MRKRFGMAVVAIVAVIGRSAAFASGAVITIQDLSGTFLNPCNGELIDFTGSALFVNQMVELPDGSIHRIAHANTQGVSGIGQTTGGRYRLIESVRVQETLTP